MKEYLIQKIIFSLLLLSLSSFLLAQSKHKLNQEIGLDFSYFSNQLVFHQRWSKPTNFLELIYKSHLKKGDLRIRLAYSRFPLHNNQFLGDAIFLSSCPTQDFMVGYRNIFSPGKHYYLGMGYAGVKKIKKFAVFAGADLGIGLYRGSTLIYSIRCHPAVGPYGYSLRKSLLGRYNSLGLNAFWGGKMWLHKRIILSFELGIRGNFLFGQRGRIDEQVRTRYFPYREWNWDSNHLTNDLSVSFLF